MMAYLRMDGNCFKIGLDLYIYIIYSICINGGLTQVIRATLYSTLIM